MRRFAKKLSKAVLGTIIAAGMVLCSGMTAKADTTEDAVNALYAQQLAVLQQYQATVLAQYQAGISAQYQAALTAQEGLQQIQENAVSQAFLLNAVQAMQKAQYQAMIQKEGLDYQGYLMEELKGDQYEAMKAFLGYNGL